MNTTDPVDLEALRDMRFAADNGGATEGQCYSWWKGITAELTARRARDAEVEALVAALREAMEWNWLDEDAPPSTVADQCEKAIAPFAGDKP